MDSQQFPVHAHTPVIAVQDPRALSVRRVQLYRRAVGGVAEVRVGRQTFDTLGRPVARRDPRLFALFEAGAPANLIQTFTLGGVPLLGTSDAGWRLGLYGEAE